MTIFKDYIGSKDMKWWDGITRTFQRLTSTGGQLEQNKIGSIVDVLEVYGDGDTYTGVSIQAAVTAIGSRAVTLLLQPGTWTISANLTIPANISILCPQGATISVSTGITLTISGTIIAGSYQIFDGVGTIAGSPILTFKDSYWFSGTVTDSTTPTYKNQTGGGVTVTTLTANTSVSADTISEKTADTGVTIDGVKLKDSQPYCDVINEKTSAAGVTIDGVKLKDNEVYTDVIHERSGGTGVTVDGCLILDGVAAAATTTTNSDGTGTALYAVEAGMKIIRGNVNGISDAVIEQGTGFTVARNSTGIYTITWDTAFSARPTVIACAGTDYAPMILHTLANSNTTTSCRITSNDNAGNAADTRFRFIAIGSK